MPPILALRGMVHIRKHNLERDAETPENKLHINTHPDDVKDGENIEKKYNTIINQYHNKKN